MGIQPRIRVKIIPTFISQNPEFEFFFMHVLKKDALLLWP